MRADVNWKDLANTMLYVLAGNDSDSNVKYCPGYSHLNNIGGPKRTKGRLGDD
jgi:hypothetical protein